LWRYILEKLGFEIPDIARDNYLELKNKLELVREKK
jgi:hypothetical protein